MLTGRARHLIHMLEKDFMIFFKKYEKNKDAAGQEFYNVSPADLISFICDDDMQMQVNNFAQNLPVGQRETFFEKWQAHQASRGRGGADLVLVTGEHPPQYANICAGVNTFRAFNQTLTIQRPLLKNPDGVICWKGKNDKLHWYYANHDTKTSELIDIPEELRLTHQAEYDAFATRMANMEPNTARRSSNQEHALIRTIMLLPNSHKNHIHLVREGINYRQDGIDYIDTHYDFNRLINAYLKCIPLNNNDEGALMVWRAELGHMQREVIWLIQRYCQINNSFFPLVINYKAKSFVRSNNFYNVQTGHAEPVFDERSGHLVLGLGLDNSDSGFAIYKGAGNEARKGGAGGPVYMSMLASIDLVAVTRLSIDAINSIDNFRPSATVVMSSKKSS